MIFRILQGANNLEVAERFDHIKSLFREYVFCYGGGGVLMEMWDIELFRLFYFWYVCPKYQMPILKMKASFKELQILDLGDNHLNDTFPMWLGTLPELQVLSLRSNKLRGSIRTSRIENMFPQLRTVDLSYNVFLCNLPTSLFQHLKAMRSIDRAMKSLEYLGDGYD